MGRSFLLEECKMLVIPDAIILLKKNSVFQRSFKYILFCGFNPNLPKDWDICYGLDTQVFPIAINRYGRKWIPKLKSNC